MKRKNLRQKAEKELSELELNYEDNRSLKKLVHELKVHQLELEYQNQELREAQSDLIKMRDKYHLLYELAPIAYFNFNAQGVILNVNLQATQLLGIEKNYLLNKPFLIYLPSSMQNRFYSHIKDVLNEKTLSYGNPDLEEYSLATHYQPAEKLGGDFYDIIRQNNKLIMYVSDVTGHGLDAAMMSSFIKSTINSYVAAVPLTEISLSQIVRFLAQQFLKEDYPEDYFICLALVVLDIDTGQVDYTELGLQDPLLYYNGGKSCQSLINRSLPISPVLNINEIEFEEKSITLNRGDILIFNTDGITEQRQGGKYYLKRFKEVCGQVAELPPTVISQKIIDDFYDFNANSYQADDDITYLILQAKPEDRKEFSFELESNTNEINRLRRKLEDILPSTTDGDMALMGIHELVVNAIEHGNNFNKTKRVCIELILTGDYIYTSIEDEGDGFDWKQLVKSEFDLENDSERGRGIMMASRGCDYIFYNNRGNKAFLLKYR